MKEHILFLIGKKIKDIRKDKKISQEELAFRAEINTTYLSDVERGKRNIATLNLIKIAYALNIEVGDLFPTLQELNLLLYKKMQYDKSW